MGTQYLSLGVLRHVFGVWYTVRVLVIGLCGQISRSFVDCIWREMNARLYLDLFPVVPPNYNPDSPLM